MASRSTPSWSPPVASASRGSHPSSKRFSGETLHAFDYPGAERLSGIVRTLVYGNGVSGLEIASDLAPHAPVISAFRKPRYVIQKVVDGVSSDWQWYTLFGALDRRCRPPTSGVPGSASGSSAWPATPPTRRAGAERGPPGRGRVAVSGLLVAGARRQHRVPSRHRLGRGAERDLHRRLDRGGRGHHLRDRLRRRRSVPEPGRPRTGARAVPAEVTRTCPASVSSVSSSPRGRTSRCSSCRRAGSWRSGAER